MKTCRRCGQAKPLEEFYRRPDAKDGYRNECIACVQTLLREQIMPSGYAYNERSVVERLLSYYRNTGQPTPLDLQARAEALGFILDQE